MISIKLSFKLDIYQLFILTLIFDRIGRLGQSSPFEPPVKFWLWALKLKNRLVEPFKVPIIKSRLSKKMFFGGHFPTEHNGVTNYCFSLKVAQHDVVYRLIEVFYELKKCCFSSNRLLNLLSSRFCKKID